MSGCMQAIPTVSAVQTLTYTVQFVHDDLKATRITITADTLTLSLALLRRGEKREGDSEQPVCGQLQGRH